MNKIIVCSVALFLFSVVTFAQDITPRTTVGDRALLFSINGFGNFGVRGSVAASIGGAAAVGDSSPGIGRAEPIYGIGARYFFAPKTAFRVSLGFGTSTSSDGTETGNGRSATVFGLTPAIELHMVQSGSVTAYVGGFASLATVSAGGEGDEQEYSSSATSISLGGILGVEFFPWRELSLGAEYQLGARFSSSSTTAAGTSTDGPSSTDFGIGTVAVRLGVWL